MPPNDPIRLLCLADIHLGRSAPSLPAEFDLTRYTSRAAWEELVHYATSHPIDAVLLAGDVVDQDDLFFETYNAFEKGVRKILNQGIPIIAVAGNHDSAIFRKLVQTLSSPHFYLLGKEGKWESVNLAFKGREISFAGWSFPEQHAAYNPLKKYREDLPMNCPAATIGLLHCDCPGNQQSLYAPVKVEDFQSLPPQAWVLGHSHKPVIFSEDPLVFYCGSLQGLDSSESGSHGAHLLNLFPSGQIKKETVPFSKIRWEKLEISDISLDSFEETLIRELLALHHSLIQDNSPLEIVGCRLTLSGRTKGFRAMPESIEKLYGRTLLSQPNLEGREIHYFIENVVNETKPDINLYELAEGKDPVAHLARRLIEIQEGKTPLEPARQSIEKMQIKFPHFAHQQLSDEQLKELLFKSGFHALDLLLSQKEGKNEA